MIKRIPTPPQGAQANRETDHAVANALAMTVAVVGASRGLGGEAIDLVMLIENALASARFQGYRQAMDDAELDEAGWPGPITGFGASIDRKHMDD